MGGLCIYIVLTWSLLKHTLPKTKSKFAPENRPKLPPWWTFHLPTIQNIRCKLAGWICFRVPGTKVDFTGKTTMSKATSSCLGGKHPKGFYPSMEQNDVSLLEFVLERFSICICLIKQWVCDIAANFDYTFLVQIISGWWKLFWQSQTFWWFERGEWQGSILIDQTYPLGVLDISNVALNQMNFARLKD